MGEFLNSGFEGYGGDWIEGMNDGRGGRGRCMCV